MYKVYIVNKEDEEDKTLVGERESVRGAERLQSIGYNRINNDYKVRVEKLKDGEVVEVIG